MVIDVKNRLEIPTMPTGLMGQISITRLTKELQRSGELRPNETITHLALQPNGLIQYRVEFL